MTRHDTRRASARRRRRWQRWRRRRWSSRSSARITFEPLARRSAASAGRGEAAPFVPVVSKFEEVASAPLMGGGGLAAEEDELDATMASYLE